MTKRSISVEIERQKETGGLIMVIDANTKIGKILKANQGALEAIVSISPKFEKLRNPFLRKIMAGRTTLAMAAGVGGCKVEEFFRVLEPLGFLVGDIVQEEEDLSKQDFPTGPRTGDVVPGFLQDLSPQNTVTLDVRPVLEKGEDPLKLIQATVRKLKQGEALKLVNTFEPTPLIALLGKQGFQVYVDTKGPDMVETYFQKKSADTNDGPKVPEMKKEGWEQLVLSFMDKLEEVDVRNLEMPGPMVAILEALDKLGQGKALYVFHKRVPVFLIPELKQRNFDYRIREISDSEVHLLIFHESNSPTIV